MNCSELLKINVNDQTEKKNGLTYLSWAWAWAKILIIDNAATFEVRTFNGLPYMDVNGTGMVWIDVTVHGKTITAHLPVMDYRNKPITKPDAFAVNTAIMRCLVKGIALHGLGLYIYAGEDLPEVDAKEDVKDSVKEEVKENATKIITKAITKIANGEDVNKAKMELFAEGIMEYTKISPDAKDLVSYWKNNQQQLDALKVSNANLYQQVVNKFKEVKNKLESKDGI